MIFEFTFFNWFIVALAVWRITSLLVDESGPSDILVRFRRLVGVRKRTTEQGTQRYGTNWVASGLTCVWCTSVWVAFILWPLFFFFPSETLWVCLPFSWSAIAVFIKVRVTH